MEIESSSEICVEETKYYWVSLETVLEKIGTHRVQVMILMISSLCYGHFSAQSMVPALCTQSLWAKWPYLKDRPVLYNSVFAACAVCRLVGSVLFLPMIDKLGRRPFLFVFTIISAVVGLVSAASPNFAVYTVLRAVDALFTSVVPAASTIYSVEMVMMQRRAIPAMLCQCIACLYVTYAIGIKMALDNSTWVPQAQVWRWSQGLMQAPTLVALILMALTWLETPRFLAAAKRDPHSAWRTLGRMTPHGEEGLRGLLELEGEEMSKQRLDEVMRIRGIDDTEEGEPKSRRARIFGTFSAMLTLFTTHSYRLPAIGLVLCWALQSFAHWGMSTYMTVFFEYLNVSTNWTSLGAFLFQIPVHLLVFLTMQANWGGRLLAIRLCAFGSSVATVLLAICIGVHCSSAGLLMFLCITSQAIGGPLWGPLYSYSAERFPTTIRGASMGLFGAVTAASTVATTYVGSVTLDKSRLWVFPLVWGCLRIAIVLASLLLDKEVRGRKLEDVCREDSSAMSAKS